MSSIATIHKNRFDEICKNLDLLGAKESSFTRVELLFYEAITIAREYGNEMAENGLLSHLKHLEGTLYHDTKSFFRKSSQRERAIRKFISNFKKVLHGV